MERNTPLPLSRSDRSGARRNRFPPIPVLLSLAFALVALASASSVRANARLGFHGLYAIPGGDPEPDLSSGGPGLGAYLSVPPFSSLENLAGLAGFEFFSVMATKEKFVDPDTGLQVEHETDQTYVRIYLGPSWRPVSLGRFRPYVDGTIALVSYGIRTDLVIPNDSDPENEVRQKLSSEHHVKFGYGLGAGIDFRCSPNWSLRSGVRWTATSKVNQQLGSGARKVYPQYLHIHLGVEFLLTMGQKEDSSDQRQQVDEGRAQE